MKRLILFLAMILLPATGFAQSGTIGNLKWSLSGGTLTISGNGAIPDYEYSKNPWVDFKVIITTAIIGEGVTRIGNNAFSACVRLMSVTIPGSVTSIGDDAFAECYRLTFITIPSSVTTIGVLAFNSSSSLTDVTVEWTTPLLIQEYTFEISSSATLHVPPGTKTLYEAADVWKDFKTIVEQK